MKTSKSGFSEEDFTALAGALDRTHPSLRNLFLVKLVVLLGADSPGAVRDAIGRALQHMPEVA